MTTSAGIRLPDARVVTVPCSCGSTASTVSPNRKVTDRSRRWNFSASTISESQNSSIWSRRSTTVTRVPSAANIDAYSTPMTPAPTTTIVAGTDSRPRMPSESTIRLPSKATSGGRAGRVPVAMTNLSAVTVRACEPSAGSTTTVCGSTNRPVPCSSVTWLRISWLRMISISRPMTCWVRDSRSWIVMSSLTR